MPGTPNSDGLSKELERQRKYWKKNFLWTTLALIAAAIYFLFSSPAAQIVCGDTALSITAPDNTVTQIEYRSITDVQLQNKPDYGTSISGAAKKGCDYGTWRNTLWGTYYRCSYDKAACCVVITTADGVTAISQENGADTQSLFETIRAKLG